MRAGPIQVGRGRTSRKFSIVWQVGWDQKVSGGGSQVERVIHSLAHSQMETLYSLSIHLPNNPFIDKKTEINVKVDRAGKTFNTSYFSASIMMAFHFPPALTFCSSVSYQWTCTWPASRECWACGPPSETPMNVLNPTISPPAHPLDP